MWPFLDSMNPAQDVLAQGAVEVDLAPIQPGQRVTVRLNGIPIFVAHRTATEIAEAKAGDGAGLRHPEPDDARVQRDEWLIVEGVCPHLGCVPKGQGLSSARGQWSGWFCPCHGSHFDSSGRIRKGPAPTNLAVPTYHFIDDKRVRIG
jgi:ubiquinol-cytochrome c reductase iron-sulfur subunit